MRNNEKERERDRDKERDGMKSREDDEMLITISKRQLMLEPRENTEKQENQKNTVSLPLKSNTFCSHK